MVEPGQVARDGPVVAPVSAGDLQGDVLGDPRLELTAQRVLVQAVRATLHVTLKQHEGRKEMFYLTTQSTHFIYGYMASDIWLRTRCRHIGYSYRLTARVLLYAPSHRQDGTYHGLCYTSRGALAGMRNSSMGPPHER